MTKVIKKLELNKNNVTKWSEEELKNLAIEFRKRTKPMIIACNKVDIKQGKENYERLKNEFSDHILVPCSAESELALKEAAKHEIIEYIPGENDFKIIGELNEKQKKALEFIKTNVLDAFNSTGAEDVLDKAVFELLKYICVFPVANSHLEDKDGNKLPDCLLVPENITAHEFAYKVHSDIGDKFIKAIDLKTKKTIGKEHKLNHRDVVEIITSK